jgi:hypothetical protein
MTEDKSLAPVEVILDDNKVEVVQTFTTTLPDGTVETRNKNTVSFSCGAPVSVIDRRAVRFRTHEWRKRE